MTDILEEITAHKRRDLITLKEKFPPAQLYKTIERSLAQGSLPHHSLPQALRNSAGQGIIAEFKRKSPSLGWISPETQAEDVIPNYVAGGATALSILTDEPYFGGSLDFIVRIRPHVSLPILRKDFIIDEYQLFEAKAIGADAVLLIAACLNRKECHQLALTARGLGLDVLLEIHEESEINYLDESVSVAGINNRNLHLFRTDLQTSLRLAPLIPPEFVKISESGIRTAQQLQQLRSAGYDGFLMGERFMTTPNPGQALHTFIQELQP